MKIVLYLLAFGVLFVLYVRYLESTSVFYPSKEILTTPRDIGLPFEDVYFLTEDNLRLNGWFLKVSGAKSTLIYFHGNAGTMSDCLATILYYYDLGLNVFIIDYRGFGNSEGRPTEEGMYKDAVAAFDYLKKRDDVDPERLIAYGSSLGGAAAVDLATKRDVAAIIIDSSFSSAKDMAKVIYPFVPSFMVSLKFDSIGKVQDMSIPKLFIHSENDEMIPFALGKKLFDAASEPKEFLRVNGTHNETRTESDEKNVTDTILEFLKQNRFM